eukprot:CAMPEP_0113564778 /NCGR_PEP_ID=MMETSP0015_2-20120614/21810_1 /TAXON_ID=2838 /ORGANISM="Odontella" /LENGTH=210 /DNA_ID=CAMNT_0000466901 /DNA_START=692 /DNA_END=1321 /DNA_ORIENTATION=+ /assembly_acc=CAM_ASM_000160
MMRIAIISRRNIRGRVGSFISSRRISTRPQNSDRPIHILVNEALFRRSPDEPLVQFRPGPRGARPVVQNDVPRPLRMGGEPRLDLVVPALVLCLVGRRPPNHGGMDEARVDALHLPGVSPSGSRIDDPGGVDAVAVEHVGDVLPEVPPERRQDEVGVGAFDESLQAGYEIVVEADVGGMFGTVEDPVDVEEDDRTREGDDVAVRPVAAVR